MSACNAPKDGGAAPRRVRVRHHTLTAPPIAAIYRNDILVQEMSARCAMLSVDPVILGMIALYPSSGYDMKAELEKGGAGMFSALTFGSIYPRLSALEDEGYIVTFAADNQGRRRKV